MWWFDVIVARFGMGPFAVLGVGLLGVAGWMVASSGGVPGAGIDRVQLTGMTVATAGTGTSVVVVAPAVEYMQRPPAEAGQAGTGDSGRSAAPEAGTAPLAAPSASTTAGADRTAAPAGNAPTGGDDEDDVRPTSTPSATPTATPTAAATATPTAAATATPTSTPSPPPSSTPVPGDDDDGSADDDGAPAPSPTAPTTAPPAPPPGDDTADDDAAGGDDGNDT
jgi:hypothetical protein